jgi:hypothetical protein
MDEKRTQMEERRIDMNITRAHPIIMNAEEVLGIISGRKTVTREVIKPQPDYIESSGRWRWLIPKLKQRKNCCTEVVTASREWWEYLLKDQFRYQPGDQLWVRETFHHCSTRGEHRDHGCIDYRADNPGDYVDGWYSPSLMPRWASRILLEITAVRVERVQDISYADIIAEGFTEFLTDEQQTDIEHITAAIRCFGKQWDSTNAKRGYGWDVNPWVWVREFRIGGE